MIICGLDECGRGPLAGPIVAAGVIMKSPIEGLADSKKLTAAQREKLYKQIMASGALFSVEQISVNQINTKGIAWANKIVFKRLAKKLVADKYIADGSLKLGKKIQSIVKADDKFPEVMAASIIAKVWRDRLMDMLHTRHPHYKWSSNKGYGTQDHVLALQVHGPTEHHRNLFVDTALKNKI